MGGASFKAVGSALLVAETSANFVQFAAHFPAIGTDVLTRLAELFRVRACRSAFRATRTVPSSLSVVLSIRVCVCFFFFFFSPFLVVRLALLSVILYGHQKVIATYMYEKTMRKHFTGSRCPTPVRLPNGSTIYGTPPAPRARQVFNSRATQLVLGAGAIHSAAKLKSISAKHLALCCQSLGLVKSLIPLLKAALATRLPQKHHLLLAQMDAVSQVGFLPLFLYDHLLRFFSVLLYIALFLALRGLRR